MRRLVIVLAAAAALLIAGAPAAGAVDIIPDVLGCDTIAPMNNPNSGVIAVDKGPNPIKTGDPFAAKPTVSKYDIYGYAGMEWVNHDLGCGPDAMRDTDNTVAGAIANFQWNALLGMAATGTAIQRWTYSPATLAVFEPVQRVAAEALGSRVFIPLFGISLLVVGGYIIWSGRRGNVHGAANHAGWALLVTVMAMVCIIWPAKVAPAADGALTSTVAYMNAAVAGTSPDKVNIADANAANIQNGILYSTWASGTFGRSSGGAVDKYGPILFKNGALTREESRLLDTDPEAAQKLIEAKQDRFREAAQDLKAEDPIAYDYLAGKHNWNRFWSATVAWIAYLCTMLYLLLASLLLLFALIIIRVAVMLLPLLAVAAVYYPARHHIIKVLDYVAGAIAAAVMFGGAAAIFTAIAGGIMSPTTNTPLLLTALLMLLVTIAGFKITKPMRSIKAMGMPGLNSFRGDTSTTPGPASTPVAPQAPTPKETYTRPQQPSMVRTAVGGAMAGAAAGAGFAAVTGGASVAAGAATGAAKAATAATVTQATGSAMLGSAAGNVAGAKALPSAVKALPAGTAAAPQAPNGRVVHETPDPVAPARGPIESAQIWQPGESNPADHLSPTSARKGVYPIFTPQEATR